MRNGVALATKSLLALARFAALVAVVLAVIALAASRPARADDDKPVADAKAASQGRVVIDRIDVEPSRLGMSRIRALVSAVAQLGARVPIVGTGKGMMAIKLGGAKASDAITGAFDTSDVELALVIVVPVTYDFDGDLETIRDQLKTNLLTPLGKLGPRVQVAIIGYAESTSGSRKLGNVAAAIATLDKLEIDSTPPNLTAAVQRAVTLVKNAIKKPKNPGALVRGVVLVVSDGAGVSAEEHPAISKLGAAAGKDHVRITALAYSPANRVRPLFTLGELSRQSRGSFRWIRTSGGWTAVMAQVLDELQHETVVTMFAPPEELTDKKMVVVVPVGGGTLESEAVKLPEPTCGPDPCDGYCNRDVCVLPLTATGGGLLIWFLIGGGGLVGLIALIGGISVVRRKGKSAPMPMMPGPMGMPPGAAAVGFPGGPPAMPGGPPPMPAGPAPIAPGAPVLIIMSGPRTGQKVALKNGFTIGKAPGSDLDLSDDATASSNHAMVTFDGASWTLTDRGSTNGTHVNGARVQAVRLDPNTTVRLGSTDVRFGYQ